jgi:hypothetical protein
MNATTDIKNTVNQVIDLKGPLKGKGGSLAQWQSDVKDRLEQVYQEMELLGAESKSVEGRRFGLYVYGLRSGRQLRWRMTNSAHATWERVEPLLDQVSDGLAQWYRQAQVVAQILNHREQVLRYELKTVERLMVSGGASGGARVPRDYRMSVGRGAGGGRPRRTAEGGTPDAPDAPDAPDSLAVGDAAVV